MTSNSVSFGAVQVREFERIAGEHPDCWRGPSLSIGWGFVQKEDVPVDTVHNQEEEQPKMLAPLNAETRRFLLAHVFDISKQDIETSEELAEEVRMHRKESYWRWKQHLEEEEEEENVDAFEEEFSSERILRPSSRRMSGIPALRKNTKPKNQKSVFGMFRGMKRSVRSRLQSSLHRH